jgi:hypothetical protein
MNSQFETYQHAINKMTKDDIIKHMQIVDDAMFNIKTKMIFCDADGVQYTKLQEYIKLRKYIQHIYDNQKM